MARTPEITFDLSDEFNLKVMREFGLDVSAEGYIYWMDTEEIIQLKDKYIKYCEEDNPILAHNEIEMNLLSNARLMETLAYSYLKRRINNEIVAISQDVIRGSNRGHFVLSYMKDGQVMKLSSDPFINDSVRVFNLITKINHTEHLYTEACKRWDIPVKREYK